MRVAVVSDIHGNLPALDATLEELERERPDVIVVGGDVAGGPMPSETIERLLALGDRARFVMGNGDREMVEAFDRGARPEDTEQLVQRGTNWAAGRLSRSQRDVLAGFEPVVRLEVDGLGPTLFCHGSPRSDTEIITGLTGEDRLEDMLAGVAEAAVVCGHTHRQFDRTVLGKRLVNAGAVGMPYEGDAAAFWLMLGPGVELRRTAYDVTAALERLRAGGYPAVDEAFRESLLEPADPQAVTEYFEGQRTA